MLVFMNRHKSPTIKPRSSPPLHSSHCFFIFPSIFSCAFSFLLFNAPFCDSLFFFFTMTSLIGPQQHFKWLPPFSFILSNSQTLFLILCIETQFFFFCESRVCFGESSSHQEMDINVIGIPPPTKKNSASNSMKQKKVYLTNHFLLLNLIFFFFSQLFYLWWVLIDFFFILLVLIWDLGVIILRLINLGFSWHFLIF